MRICIVTLVLLIVQAAPAQTQPASAPATRPTYPVPYGTPTRAQITAQLERLHGYLDQVTPFQLVNSRTREPLTDISVPNAEVAIGRRDRNTYELIGYTAGVWYAGLLLASDVTGDARYKQLVASRMQLIHDGLPQFRSLAERNGPDRNPFRAMLATRSLDDSGAMCAALIKARLANVGPDNLDIINHYGNYVGKEQFRLPDGTLARHRPQPESVWADDMYMSIPALTQMGKLTGDRKWFDDAAKQNLQFAKYLFNANRGIYFHGVNLNQPDNPEFYWARANGWAMMATVELLSELPEDHPSREAVLKLLRAHVKGIASMQSRDGMWHNMLDKPDTYTETSASAMFAFAISRAINRGWISPVGYGAVAMAGWNGISTRINDQGQVEGTCVATTFANDNVYYHNRPTSVHATHGYGPVILAAAEMIRLIENPRFEIQSRNSAVHFVPRPPATQDGPDEAQ